MNNTMVRCKTCQSKNRVPAAKQHLNPKCGNCKSTLDITKEAIPVELTDYSFHEFIKKASLPVLVDFFSPTCGPCQTMTPAVNNLAILNINKHIIAKIDASRNQAIASFFKIRGVPSFLFFKNGRLENQITGAVSQKILQDELDKLR